MVTIDGRAVFPVNTRPTQGSDTATCVPVHVDGGPNVIKNRDKKHYRSVTFQNETIVFKTNLPSSRHVKRYASIVFFTKTPSSYIIITCINIKGKHFCFFFYLSDDYNRVVLDQLPDVPDSDYINASYVDVSNIIRSQ